MNIGNLIGKYQNGNYEVRIYNDGTKVRENNLDFLIPDFPESMDIKITDYCNNNCPMCHEKSSVNGRHGDLNVQFLNTLSPYTELAIGGGNPLSHPNLTKFLCECKKKKLVPSITVASNHFMENFAVLKTLTDSKLIYGLGISLGDTVSDEFVDMVKQIPNAVIHIINGIVDLNELSKLYDKDIKILILGYKQFGRGEEYYSPQIERNKQIFKENLSKTMSHFSIVSFDNLAIKQLSVKDILSPSEWSKFYMGDDGQYTMYIDLVNQEFAKSSTSKERFPLKDNIRDMFEVVRNFKINK